VIFDEAHELEEVASNYFGIGLSTQRFDELIRDVDLMLKAKQASTSAIESACATLKDRSRMFFGALPTDTAGLGGGVGRMPFEFREEFLEETATTTLELSRAYPPRSELDRIKNVEESPACASAPPTSRSPRISARIQRPQHSLLDRAPGARGSQPRSGCGTRGLPHASAGYADRRLRAALQLALRQLLQRRPHLGHTDCLGWLRPHPQALGLTTPANWLFHHTSTTRAGTALSAAHMPDPREPDFPREGSRTHPPSPRDHQRPSLLPL